MNREKFSNKYAANKQIARIAGVLIAATSIASISGCDDSKLENQPVPSTTPSTQPSNSIATKPEGYVCKTSDNYNKGPLDNIMDSSEAAFLGESAKLYDLMIYSDYENTRKTVGNFLSCEGVDSPIVVTVSNVTNKNNEQDNTRIVEFTISPKDLSKTYDANIVFNHDGSSSDLFNVPSVGYSIPLNAKHG